MITKLTPDEIEDLKYLVQVYSKLWEESEEYTKRLEDLTSEREDLISKIESHSEDLKRIREQEGIFEIKLKQKYGEFKIDMETYEIYKVV
jgi:predicted nuclease with TOPRIM domain